MKHIQIAPLAKLKRSMLKRLCSLIVFSCLMLLLPVHATPLLNAVANNDLTAVQSILQQSSNRNQLETRDELGRTPLLMATDHNRIAIARELIAAGADVNAKDARQDSPYLLAGAQGRLEILKMTLAHGADLGSTNRYGGTALIPAAERGHVAVVRTLIDAGVKVDHINRLGWTALLEAIILSDGGTRHQEIVHLLIAAGANVNLADKDGITPLQHAQRRNYTAMVAQLRAAGAR